MLACLQVRLHACVHVPGAQPCTSESLGTDEYILAQNSHPPCVCVGQSIARSVDGDWLGRARAVCMQAAMIGAEQLA